MSYVIVQCPVGSVTFPGADADVFERDTLTISYQDAGMAEQFGDWQVFAPGSWLDATAFDDANDLPRYHFMGEARRRECEAVAAKYQTQERTVA